MLRLNRTLQLTLLVVALGLGWRWVEPGVDLELLEWRQDAYGGDSTQADDCIERLAALGPRAVGPVLARVRNETAWSKRTSRLPQVLQKIGLPAHAQLLTAIDQTQDPFDKIQYTYCLQQSFDDFDRLPGWLDLLPEHPASSLYLKDQLFARIARNTDDVLLHHLALLNRDCSLVPDLFQDGKSKPGSRAWNPAFLKWYKVVSGPGGPLPAWDPALRS